MDNSTAILMIKALDGLAARSVATAENIANAGTANYRPLRTTFEDALKDAAVRGDDAVSAVAPKVEPAIAGTPDAKLRVDLEMGTAAGTALRYGALVEVMNRQLELEFARYHRKPLNMQAMEISRTALDVEWRRLEVIAENLANAGVANSPATAPYQALQLLSGPKADFSSLLDAKDKADAGIDFHKLAGVTVYGIQAGNEPPRMVHEPGNPSANAQGLVAYPAIDQAQQMTQMVQTARSYEANIVAMNAAKEIYSKALQIGGRS